MTIIARTEPIPIAYSDPNDFNNIRRTVPVRVDASDGIVGRDESIAMWPEACRYLPKGPGLGIEVKDDIVQRLVAA